jgi:Mg2+-importing ATPase
MSKLPYWNLSPSDAYKEVDSTPEGLSSTEADIRLNTYGKNTLDSKKSQSQIMLFVSQFKNPIVLILLFATIISALSQEWFDAQIILVIILASAILSFYQEYGASQAVEKLRSKVQVLSSVKRNGEYIDIPSS